MTGVVLVIFKANDALRARNKKGGEQSPASFLDIFQNYASRSAFKALPYAIRAVCRIASSS